MFKEKPMFKDKLFKPGSAPSNRYMQSVFELRKNKWLSHGQPGYNF